MKDLQKTLGQSMTEYKWQLVWHDITVTNDHRFIVAWKSFWLVIKEM